MANLQKIVLTIVLALDVALLLYPPFIIRGRHLGHDLFFDGRGDIDFGTLAAQIIIVSIIGLIVFLLARVFSSK